MSQTIQNFPPPPKRSTASSSDDESQGVYTRDPHRLTAFLVPFPKPNHPQANELPDRFLIYTPPAPPLSTPKEGEKETHAHKLQRKWQTEVREAKTSKAKVTSWKGLKGRATKGINYAIGKTTSSSLDFLNRVPDSNQSSGTSDAHADDGHPEGEETSKTVGLEEMVLIYPPWMPGNEEEIRKEFVESMLRSKSKAQRDAVIATGLMPVSFGIDLLMTVIWPFGGLVEIDGVWAYSSMKGAKTARSVTKRINSTGDGNGEKELKLTFTPSSRVEILRKYLAAECSKRNRTLFNSPGPPPIESDILNVIGWHPSQTGGETHNWEDEQWETEQVKEDFRQVMQKGAREWEKWIKQFEKDPEKALKKQ